VLTDQVNALYTHMGINHNVYAVYDSKEKLAHEVLLDKMEHYFAAGKFEPDAEPEIPTPTARITKTSLPPVYLQQPGHSLTVVGLERHKSGRRYLIVLDPTFPTSKAMRQFLDVGPRRVVRPNLDVIEFYRRGGSRLHPHNCFEMVM
jgi:hypothetical protein